MNKYDICNLALSFLGNTNKINSFTENSNEAALCGSVYDIARKTLLTIFPWNFAVKQAALTVTTETNKDYEFVYEYPSDAIRVLRIFTGNEINMGVVNQYQVIGSRIVTDIADAQVEYIIDAADFPPVFEEALAYKIASMVAIPLSSSPQITQYINNMALTALDTAKRMCALERHTEQVRPNRYLDARR